MKKIFCFIISALIFVSLTVCASAYDYGTGARDSLVNDYANLMSYEDAQTLNYKLEQISELYECEVSVLTVTSTDGYDLTAFADDYYDYNGFGYGEYDDGIMLVVDMGGREYAMTTYGTAISIFDDFNLYLIENAFLNYLSQGSYTDAFIAYYEECADVLYNYYYTDYSDDGYYVTDDDYVYEDLYPDYSYDDGINQTIRTNEIFSLKWIGISVAGGLIIALIYTFFLKSQLHTVKSKNSASDYLVEGSINITRSRDIFMYKNVHKTPKPKSNTSSGGRSGGGFGGGSSTHVSSSGRSHGGSRGSF